MPRRHPSIRSARPSNTLRSTGDRSTLWAPGGGRRRDPSRETRGLPSDAQLRRSGFQRRRRWRRDWVVGAGPPWATSPCRPRHIGRRMPRSRPHAAGARNPPRRSACRRRCGGNKGRCGLRRTALRRGDLRRRPVQRDGARRRPSRTVPIRHRGSSGFRPGSRVVAPPPARQVSRRQGTFCIRDIVFGSGPPLSVGVFLWRGCRIPLGTRDCRRVRHSLLRLWPAPSVRLRQPANRSWVSDGLSARSCQPGLALGDRHCGRPADCVLA